MESVAGMAWNGWPPSRGISGRFGVEWVAGLLWNRWQEWPGIRRERGEKLWRVV